MKIVIFGPQGAGKGTQAKLLSKKLGVPHVSTGDLFREEVRKESELGVAIRRIVESGRLVPDEIVLFVTEKRLRQPDCANGFIADGFPRNLGQLLALPQVWRVDHAIHLWIDIQTSLDRLATRINCLQCQAIYGPKNPPKKPGICDKCGAELSVRADDAAAESVTKRLQIYWSEMLPVIEYYRSAGVLTTIDGRQSIEAIGREIAMLLKL